MKLVPVVAAMAVLLALAPPTSAAGDVADSPEHVRPLLVGATAPSELEVRKADGESFDLGAAFAKKPTILVLYRGGW